MSWRFGIAVKVFKTEFKGGHNKSMLWGTVLNNFGSANQAEFAIASLSRDVAITRSGSGALTRLYISFNICANENTRSRLLLIIVFTDYDPFNYAEFATSSSSLATW